MFDVASKSLSFLQSSQTIEQKVLSVPLFPILVGTISFNILRSMPYWFFSKNSYKYSKETCLDFCLFSECLFIIFFFSHYIFVIWYLTFAPQKFFICLFVLLFNMFSSYITAKTSSGVEVVWSFVEHILRDNIIIIFLYI